MVWCSVGLDLFGALECAGQRTPALSSPGWRAAGHFGLSRAASEAIFGSVGWHSDGVHGGADMAAQCLVAGRFNLVAGCRRERPKYV